MSNGIHPLRPGGANPYLQTAQSAPSASSRAQAEKAEQAAAPARTQETASARLQGLSNDEAEMIDALFPESATSMRLYGPGGSNRQITPRAVGGRLDLSA